MPEEGNWLSVVEILSQARTLDGMQFDVLANDRRRYRLEWAEAQDTWSVTAFQSTNIDPSHGGSFHV